MPRQTDLLYALRDWGLNVIEVNGWQTRGYATFNPKGSVNHHTAGSRNNSIPSLRILVEGRSGLPGPLCNVAQSRSTEFNPGQLFDDVYLVAAGRANHAGSGGWKGLTGNSSVFGLEIEHTGNLSTEPWPERRAHTAHRVHCAFAQVGGFSNEYVCQHKEWAPTRKIDFIGANGNDFRFAVALTQLGRFTKEEFMACNIDVVEIIDRNYEEAWGAGKKPDVPGLISWAAHIGFAQSGAEFKQKVNDLRKGLGLRLVP